MATVAKARSALFEQLVRDVDYWVEHATKSATRFPPAGAGSDVRWAFERVQALAKSESDRRALEVACRDTLIGLIHSIFVSIDGGSRLADTVRVDLVTDQGKSLGPALHELFIDYLLNTNRWPDSPRLV
jgi:hypothetical protein